MTNIMHLWLNEKMFIIRAELAYYYLIVVCPVIHSWMLLSGDDGVLTVVVADGTSISAVHVGGGHEVDVPQL